MIMQHTCKVVTHHCANIECIMAEKDGANCKEEGFGAKSTFKNMMVAEC